MLHIIFTLCFLASLIDKQSRRREFLWGFSEDDFKASSCLLKAFNLWHLFLCDERRRFLWEKLWLYYFKLKGDCGQKDLSFVIMPLIFIKLDHDGFSSQQNQQVYSCGKIFTITFFSPAAQNFLSATRRRITFEMKILVWRNKIVLQCF